MQAGYWRQKWIQNEIAFHQGEANPALVAYFSDLGLPRGSRVFVPLCGKSLDVAWLLANGYRVAAAELSEIAIDQLFSELGVEPTIAKLGKLHHYSGPNLDIFVGDIFDLTQAILGEICFVYDRAALVALPESTRRRYTGHLTGITRGAPQLLISCEYDQTLMEGPPFSVSDHEVNELYGHAYDVTLRATTDVSGGLKGKCAAKEKVWLLRRPA